MKKMIGKISIVATIVMVAWSLAAILYFTAISAHFNSEEQRENADKNRNRNTDNGVWLDGRSVRQARRNYDKNEHLANYIKHTARTHYAPQTVKRDATGRFDGNRLWRST